MFLAKLVIKFEEFYYHKFIFCLLKCVYSIYAKGCTNVGKLGLYTMHY